MNESKAFASLSPTLLARKGAARPAMRPQLHPLHQFQESASRQMSDDLGWNDMGEDVSHAGAAPDRAAAAEVVAIAGDHTPAPNVPEVVRQQASLSASVERSAPLRKSAVSQGRRAAFTLRLDTDRHLGLRLASTVLSRSAQDIVTEALDGFLAGMPEIEELAATVRKRR